MHSTGPAGKGPSCRAPTEWRGRCGGGAAEGRGGTCRTQDKPRNRESEGKPLKGLVSWSDLI